MCGESPTPTAYAVNCDQHGKVFLTAEEYDRQMSKPDSLWICPRCRMPASFDDATYEASFEGPDEDAPAF